MLAGFDPFCNRKTGLPDLRPAEDLSVEELRNLLAEKRRGQRQARLEHFRKTGRLVVLSQQPGSNSLGTLRSEFMEESLLKPARSRSRGKVWLDRLLLLVELGALAGLAFVFLNGFNLLSTLNQEVSSALVQPTLTPTAIIRDVVLPSGHTPPNSPGGSQFNEAEIPEHLRPLVQSLANLPLPTPGPQQAIRIQIKEIKVDHPVVQGDGPEQLKKGVAQHIGTPNPGLKGNLVLSAHNDIFGEIFRDLDKLKPGDTVMLFTSQRSFSYVVRQTQVVEPTQVEVMAATQEATLTLISCYPYRVDNKRIVVTAYLQETP
jgi:sortase A